MNKKKATSEELNSVRPSCRVAIPAPATGGPSRKDTRYDPYASERKRSRADASCWASCRRAPRWRRERATGASARARDHRGESARRSRLEHAPTRPRLDRGTVLICPPGRRPAYRADQTNQPYRFIWMRLRRAVSLASNATGRCGGRSPLAKARERDDGYGRSPYVGRVLDSPSLDWVGRALGYGTGILWRPSAPVPLETTLRNNRQGAPAIGAGKSSANEQGATCMSSA